MSSVIKFCKNEVVLIASALLACASMFAIPPDTEYLKYIDIRVLALLFCLMAVVGSAKEQGLFERICCSLLNHAGDVRKVTMILILLPFFLSMLVTNDVALITFVPFAIIMLKNTAPEHLIFVIIMQTIAANLGSSLTPVGNPQNLYISTFYEIPLAEFCATVAPIVLLTLILIVAISYVLVKPKPIHISENHDFMPIQPVRLVMCSALFVISILAVLRIVDYRIAFAAAVIVLLMFDRGSFRHVDISLLLTFIFLFVFVGNVARIDTVSSLLNTWLSENTLLASTVASQFISNVPAALMLSEFTADSSALLLGTNIGGLGTPIASMASLISLRFYMRSENAKTKRYLLLFTVYNVLFLVSLLLFQGFYSQI